MLFSRWLEHTWTLSASLQRPGLALSSALFSVPCDIIIILTMTFPFHVADKFNAPVDAVVLGDKDSHFLQQACYLTRGTYQKPQDQRDLLQLLLTHCLPSSYMRSKLHAPVQRTVDFRASCVCHKKPVAFAYMCSVCLALFCDPGVKCLVCETPARPEASPVPLV